MKIAVIGSGISGMTAAYLLSEDHEVVLFEANDYIGGHTNTADVTLNGHQYPVDTGFIVFNAKTYLNFVKLMKRLGIGWQDSVMSFSVQCEKTGSGIQPQHAQFPVHSTAQPFSTGFLPNALGCRAIQAGCRGALDDR